MLGLKFQIPLKDGQSVKQFPAPKVRFEQIFRSQILLLGVFYFSGSMAVIIKNMPAHAASDMDEREK